MRRLALASSAAASLTIVTGLAAFVLDPWQFSTSSVALIVLGMLMSTLVVLAGFLLVRSPWGRWGLAAATSSAMILASANESFAVLVVLVLGAVTVVALAGPWLRFWVRQQPAVDAPNPIATTLAAIAPVAPLIVGIGSYNSSHWTQWLAAITATSASFAYSRAIPGAVWALRIAMPATAVAAFAVSPLPWSLTIGLAGVGGTVAAWMPMARKTTAQPASKLPAPRSPRKDQDDAPE